MVHLCRKSLPGLGLWETNIIHPCSCCISTLFEKNIFLNLNSPPEFCPYSQCLDRVYIPLCCICQFSFLKKTLKHFFFILCFSFPHGYVSFATSCRIFYLNILYMYFFHIHDIVWRCPSFFLLSFRQQRPTSERVKLAAALLKPAESVQIYTSK